MANGKILKILSQDITSNTPDMLRKALGTVYVAKTNSDNQTNFEFLDTFNPVDPDLPDRPIEVPDDTEEDLSGRPVLRATLSEQHNVTIQKIQINPALINSPAPGAYFPNIKIPFRLYANKDRTSGDSFWRTYFMGGRHGGNVYPKLIDTSTIFYDTEVVLHHPYSFNEKNLAKFDSDARSSFWKVQPNYNDYDHFVQKYQDWQITRPEQLLPNYNVAFSAAIINGGPETPVEESGPLGAITPVFNPSWGTARDEFLSEAADTNFAEPASAILRDLLMYYYPDPRLLWSSSKNAYCGNNWLQIVQVDEMANRVIDLQSNIIFDQNYFEYFSDFLGDEIKSTTDVYDEALASFGQSIDNSSNMMNVEISFSRAKSSPRFSSDPMDGASVSSYYNYNYATPLLTDNIEGAMDQPMRIRNLIEDNNFSSKFLEILKDLDEGAINTFPYNKKRYDTNSNFLDSDGNISSTVSNADLLTFDWMQFLIYTYNNYSAGLNENYCFMGPPKLVHSTTYTDTTFYRFIDSQNLLEVIDGTIDLAQEYFDGLYNFQEATAKRVLTLEDSVDAASGIFDNVQQKIFETILSPVQKHHEILAYKIEKHGGLGSGDQLTPPNPLQKFWAFNSTFAGENISIIDSQVKYGSEYTYKGFAYVAVMSHKYKYADFRLTKQIGTNSIDDESLFCLQFYDPLTDELAEQVFSTSTNALPTFGADTTIMPASAIDTFAQSSLSNFNTFATNGQEFSLHPQLADFNLVVEPCIKIIEVPIFTKTVKILDNPPNNISVVPFHFVDNSNKLGFNLFAEGFNDANLYPTPITDVDEGNRFRYLQNKDLQITDSIKLFSESPARFVEVFRTTRKPKSFRDFDGKLVSRIDLRIENTNFNSKEFIAADMVKTNIKYYYAFRFVNENNMAGQVSPIIEAELHNDGGYIYSLFDILNSDQMQTDMFEETTTTFKKIFQLEPNLQQLIFDTSKVNFSKTARSQVNKLDIGLSETKLFDTDKKFKIRLTSKKSRKKLDINVLYNIREKDLTVVEEMYNILELDAPDEPTVGGVIPGDPRGTVPIGSGPPPLVAGITRLGSAYRASKNSLSAPVKLAGSGEPHQYRADTARVALRRTGGATGISSGNPDEIQPGPGSDSDSMRFFSPTPGGRPPGGGGGERSDDNDPGKYDPRPDGPFTPKGGKGTHTVIDGDFGVKLGEFGSTTISFGYVENSPSGYHDPLKDFPGLQTFGGPVGMSGGMAAPAPPKAFGFMIKFGMKKKK